MYRIWHISNDLEVDPLYEPYTLKLHRGVKQRDLKPTVFGVMHFAGELKELDVQCHPDLF